MNDLYEFKQRVLEEQIFNELKDRVVMASSEMRRRYKNVDITRLRTKIINYQVDTYGGVLDVYKRHHTKEENLRLASRERQRRYERRKGRR